MKRWLLCLSLIGVPSVAHAQSTVQPPTPVVVPADADEVKSVRVLLSAIHELPQRAEFEAVARDPQAIVLQVAQGDGPIADAALEASFMWPNDKTFVAAVSELTSGQSRRTNKLLMLLARHYGEQATPAVIPFLDHAQSRVRVTAAAALAEIRSEPAFAAIDRAVASEKDDATRKQLERYARRVIR